MVVYYGVIKDNRVVLDDDVQLADGTRVEVRPQPADSRDAARAEEMVKERLRTAGVLAPAAPAAPDDAEEEIEPAPVDGEPLSQMIIRERR
jgi:hypothetical protein